VAEVVGGVLSGDDVEGEGLNIDSRLIGTGQLFLALIAERDGHDYVDAARRQGAAACVVSRPRPGGTTVVVPDTNTALAGLGRWARDQLPDRVVGVTGSAGKTSTKDLLGSVLARRYRCVVSERSFNNELGVPLTLANAADGTEAGVIEMGARGPGQIRRLCGIARPSVGIVTNVGMAHTETMGSPEGVAKAKAELVEALPPSGVAVLNADDHRVAAMADLSAAPVVTFGRSGDVRAADLVIGPDLRAAFLLVSPWGEVAVRLEARGEHQVSNALAAATAALVLEVDLSDVAAGLAEARLSPWRMALERAPGGAFVLNDSYNANPGSTEAALRALAHLDARRRTAVLGPMLELGPYAEAEHRRVGDLARALKVDRLLTISAPGYGGEDVAGIEDALSALGTVGEGDAVLIKGSRAAGMERLAALLLREPDVAGRSSRSGGGPVIGRAEKC